MKLPHPPGDHVLLWNDEQLWAPENFTLSSDWSDESGSGEIPAQFRGHVFGANLAPALRWSALPDGTAEIALCVQDPDTPGRGASTHLVALIDPAVAPGLDDGDLSTTSRAPGVLLGRGSIRLGWAGPLPPKGHGPHRYVFQMYALERQLALKPGFRLAELQTRLRDAGILGRAQLIGIHETR